MTRTLCTATDVMDDLLRAGRPLDRRDLDDLMAYCASLGSTRHEWILDTLWALYDDPPPGGFDLLAAACEAAHRHGMRFDVVYKPFEGALAHPHIVLPPDFPRLPGVPLLETPGGLVHAVRPFVAAHPELSLARGPDDAVDPGGPVAAIRLVKRNSRPTRLGAADLSIWTSRVNGSFRRYEGPIQFRDSVEWRAVLPYRDASCRVLTLAGLNLPADTRFIRIDCAPTDPAGDFSNEMNDLVELYTAGGDRIPCTPSRGLIDATALFERTVERARVGLSRYLSHPEAAALLADRDAFLARCRELYIFEYGMVELTLDRDGAAVVMRGKPRQAIGQLHPIHAEVRAHWLDEVRYAIARGVDGVNLRPGCHNCPHDPWAYGFNAPTRARMAHPDNVAEAERINGEAYTHFLREAAAVLHDAGRELGVHVLAPMFQPDDRHGKPWGPLARNFAWPWETWVRDIADYVEFRGADMLRPENLRRAVDRIGLVVREAGKPFLYQCSRSPALVHFAGPYPGLTQEIDWVNRHPDVTGYLLYETANFMQKGRDGRLEGSPDLREWVRRFKTS